jgi:hypothetical protein
VSCDLSRAVVFGTVRRLTRFTPEPLVAS